MWPLDVWCKRGCVAWKKVTWLFELMIWFLGNVFLSIWCWILWVQNCSSKVYQTCLSFKGCDYVNIPWYEDRQVHEGPQEPIHQSFFLTLLWRTRPRVTVQKSVIPMQQQYRLILVDTWWYWVCKRRYWLILGGTGSVEGSNSWYMMVLGQFRAVLLGTWKYWVSIRQ